MYPHIISIAPMMGWTDRHARYFLRLISKRTLLYTEMLTTGALLNGDREYLLKYHDAEHPLALQLGGSNPDELAECSQMGEASGYDEINLNVGCPSDRVQSGMFGACLMANPDLVADCINKMRNAVNIPVTIKCRIGIDDMEDYASFKKFIESVAGAGCQTFIIHARKAWLKGLSPKQNREIPPLKYDYVYRLKQERDDLNIIINGGIKTLAESKEHLQYVDGVMFGREAYHNPYLLAEVDRCFYNTKNTAPKRDEVVELLEPYIESELATGTRRHSIVRHVLGLYHAQPGAKAWRRKMLET